MRGAGRHSVVPRRRGSPDTFQDQVRVDAPRITHRRYDTTQPRVSRLAPSRGRARCSLGKGRIVAAAFFPARARARGLDARAPRPLTPEAGEETV